MKITIERGPLLRVLNHVQSVVERRATVPILSNVLLTAEEDKLVITASDIDLEVTEGVEANIVSPGRTTVPASTLYDIVRKLPDGCQIEMTTEADRLVIAAGRSRFRLPILPAEDFPIIALAEFPTKFVMPAEKLSRIFSRVRYAISSEETRYYLMGIYFHSVDEELLAVTTDGHRLARAASGKPDEANNVEGVIIPRKCVGELLKILDETEGDVTVELSATKARFHLGDAVLTSKLIDGTFPDYNRVIPTANDKIVTVSAASLAQAIDRVSTISSERTRAVRVDLSTNKMTLTVTSSESGRAVEEVECDYSGGDLGIGFNARYFLDVLNQTKDQEVEIAFNDPAAPVVIRPKNGSSDLSVLMPMRV